jgi:hypothetical protein
MSCRGNAGDNDNIETGFGDSADFRYLGTTCDVEFEILIAVVVKNCNFWYITPCSPLKLIRRFGRTRRLHLQGLIISKARNQREAGGKQGEVKMESNFTLWNVGGLWTVYTASCPRRYNLWNEMAFTKILRGDTIRGMSVAIQLSRSFFFPSLI